MVKLRPKVVVGATKGLGPLGIDNKDGPCGVVCRPPPDQLVYMVVPKRVSDNDEPLCRRQFCFKLAKKAQEWPLRSQLASLAKDNHRSTIVLGWSIGDGDNVAWQVAIHAVLAIPHPIDGSVKL